MTAFLDAVGVSVYEFSTGTFYYDGVVPLDNQIVDELDKCGCLFRTEKDDEACGKDNSKIGPDTNECPGGCHHIVLTIKMDSSIGAECNEILDQEVNGAAMKYKLLVGATLPILAAMSACTAIENDLDRGLDYGMESRTLTRKIDERATIGKMPGINAYLWRASLDTVKSIPLVTADSTRGMILTEWYSTPSDFNDRSQMRIEVLNGDLRPDTLRVTVMRQVRRDGGWVDAPALASSVQNIEENILVRARDIRGR